MKHLVITLLLSTLLAGIAAGQLLPEKDFKPIPGVRERSGRLIVRPNQWNRGPGASLIASKALKHLSGLDMYVVKVPLGQSEREYASELMRTGKFEFAAPDFLVKPDRIPNDPLYPSQYHHTKLESARAWDLITGTRPSDPQMVIAVCDSGVFTAHPDLAGACVSGYHSPSQTPQVNGGPINDINDHGTMVAGCIAAIGNNSLGTTGIGWNLKIMPIRVTDDTTGLAYSSDINDGIYWAAAHGAKIVNVSYTGVESPAREATGAAIKSQFGSLLVHAAGNANTAVTSSMPNIIVVAATDSSDNRASFSNYGPGVDCSAPGVSILTTNRNGGYSYVSGTSFSSPITAGVLGMIWAMDPSLTPDEVESYLYYGCIDLGAVGKDPYFGNGRVNTYRSISSMLTYSMYAVPVPQGYSQAVAHGMNAASEVIGNSVNGQNTQAFRWSGTDVHDLGDIVGYSNEWGLSINVSGQCCGIAFDTPGGITDGVPFYWDGTIHAMQREPGYNITQASSINDSGQMVGVGRDIGYSIYRGFYWENFQSSPVVLPIPPGFAFSNASVIANDGKIYGYCAPFLGAGTACYWTSPTQLPVLLDIGSTGYSYSSAFSQTANGTICGDVWGPGQPYRGYTYRDGTVQLIAQPAGSWSAEATGINNTGTALGHVNYDAVYNHNFGCIWLNNIPFRIDDLIDSAFPGWSILDEQPTIQINDFGQVLGNGWLNGVRHPYIATPYTTGGQSSLTVQCSVVLGDFQGDQTQVPVTLEFTRVLTGQVEMTWTGTMDPETGTYPVPNNSNLRGLFSVRATAPHWLTRKSNVIVSDMGGIDADFSLMNGDCDGSNVIDLGDFDMLAAAFGTENGDANYVEGADLDGSGVIDLGDFDILALNFGYEGD